MSDLYHWTFKYNSEPWKVTAWAVGREPVMGSPGEFDTVWEWDIWAGHEPKLIASGEIAGQIDEPPNLSAILLDWQSQVAGAVMSELDQLRASWLFYAVAMLVFVVGVALVLIGNSRGKK